MASDAGKNANIDERVVEQFQVMRSEQRTLVNNLCQVEMDLKEHKTVIDTLKTIDKGRKCFRLIGGVLCERTVSDVLPQLEENRDQLEKIIEVVTEQVTKKGQDLNKFKEQHNIKIRGQDDLPEEEAKAGAVNRNVLVAN